MASQQSGEYVESAPMQNQPQDSEKILDWEITSAEKRKQIQKFTLIGGPIIILVSLVVLISESSEDIFATISSIIGSFVLLLVVNRLWPYHNRRYHLDDNGITISKGENEKTFLWSEFECFYLYSSERGHNGRMIGEVRRVHDMSLQIQGQIFYLKRRQDGIIAKMRKVFVVVYSEPEKSNSVLNFLSQRLTKKEMSDTTDLGLVSYEFK